MIDAGTKVWVCEQGHVDDHHMDDAGVCLRCGGEGYEEAGPAGATYSAPCERCRGTGRETNAKCSRCGGTCQHWSLDRLASEYVERQRVNVGLVVENRELKSKLREGGTDA